MNQELDYKLIDRINFVATAFADEDKDTRISCLYHDAMNHDYGHWMNVISKDDVKDMLATAALDGNSIFVDFVMILRENPDTEYFFWDFDYDTIPVPVNTVTDMKSVLAFGVLDWD